MIFAFVGWVLKATVGIIILALVVGFVMYVGDNPQTAGGYVEGFFDEVIDTAKGWFEAGKEIAD